MAVDFDVLKQRIAAVVKANGRGEITGDALQAELFRIVDAVADVEGSIPVVPKLATVATTGSYNDLSDKPPIPPAVTVDSSLDESSTNPVENKAVALAFAGIKDKIITVSDAWTGNWDIPPIASDAISASVDLTLKNSMELEWMVIGYAKYELLDASGNRIECVPVAEFSMDGQKTLRLKMRTAGTQAKTGVRIRATLLLERRI